MFDIAYMQENSSTKDNLENPYSKYLLHDA